MASGEAPQKTFPVSIGKMTEDEDVVVPAEVEEDQHQGDQEEDLKLEQEEQEGETAMQVMDDEEDTDRTQEDGEIDGVPVAAVVPSKSRSEIKHPMTSWTIFRFENRESIAKEHPHLGMTDVAKLLGEKYRNLSVEEKERLDQKAKADKWRYWSEIENSGPPSIAKTSSQGGAKPLEFIIPIGRVRKIVKLDKEVKNVSKEAYVAITKTTELFIAFMSVRCAGTASQRGVRTIRDQDVVQTIHTQNSFDFLRLDFPKTQLNKKAAPTTSRQAVSKKAVDGSNSSKPAASIKSFFAPTTSSIPDKEQDDEEQEMALDENHNNDDNSQQQLSATSH